MPYLPFHLPKSRRRPRTLQQIMAEKIQQLKSKSFTQLGEYFAKFIPKKLIRQTDSGALSRSRIFAKENIFWAFFSQVLDADGGCQEVVRKVHVYAAMQSKPLPSSICPEITRLAAQYGTQERQAGTCYDESAFCLRHCREAFSFGNGKFVA